MNKTITYSILIANAEHYLANSVTSIDLLCERWSGMGFILFWSILACKVVILKGSTVNGRQPVSIAYMLTPLKES